MVAYRKKRLSIILGLLGILISLFLIVQGLGIV
jgi:hypothetical protein